jgi:hypothetical protein
VTAHAKRDGVLDRGRDRATKRALRHNLALKRGRICALDRDHDRSCGWRGPLVLARLHSRADECRRVLAAWDRIWREQTARPRSTNFRAPDERATAPRARPLRMRRSRAAWRGTSWCLRRLARAGPAHARSTTAWPTSARRTSVLLAQAGRGRGSVSPRRHCTPRSRALTMWPRLPG